MDAIQENVHFSLMAVLNYAGTVVVRCDHTLTQPWGLNLSQWDAIVCSQTHDGKECDWEQSRGFPSLCGRQ